MTKDEILTRLFKDGHINLKELRLLDDKPTVSIPFVIPNIGPCVLTPSYPVPNPYLYNPDPYRITCQINNAGTGGELCGKSNLHCTYTAGVDPIHPNTVVHIFKQNINES